MKKLILTVAFCIAASANLLNATNIETTEEIASVNCVLLAFEVDEELGGISYEVFDAIVSACEAQQQ